jgi:hypothetical protein
MTEARGHHYVSQCYLKRFTHNGSKNSKLFVLDLATGKRFTSAPKNVAKQRDFNMIEGRPAGELENRLAGFETEVNKALDVIEQSRTMDDRDAWMHVMNLAAMFAVRNPRQRESMRRFQEQVAKLTMSMVLSSPETWESQMRQARASGHIEPDSKATDEEVREFFERDEYTVQVANASHIFNEFKVFEDVLRTLVARKWALCIAPADSGGFITSDHPICLMSSEGSPSELRRPVGHRLMETTVLFPITRNLAAMGTFENEDQVVPLSHEGVAAMNGFVMRHAERQVYAANDNFLVNATAGGLLR